MSTLTAAQGLCSTTQLCSLITSPVLCLIIGSQKWAENESTSDDWSLNLHCRFYFHLEHRSWNGNKRHTFSSCTNARRTATCSMEVQMSSPANLTGIGSWNSLSSHIVHTINGTGNGFTGDVWTANTRTRRDWSSLLFTNGTAGTCH